ncbi:MAG: thymidine phosphorylase [Acidobacteriota bacterium]
MRPQEIIAKKRDGATLSKREINLFIDGVCDSSWADYQISALLMAMFVRGLDQTEQDELTRAMIHSGQVMDLSDVGRPVVDKHSTGGVGDKTSLIIAPVAAACGLAVPMISGRGLGHTGGTLDKLESISGYSIDLSMERFKELLAKNGYAMIGQTDEIAPADKKLYAMRDATATVPCIPLIVASIMSKKLAEDLDALVLDVKTGSGAFMQAMPDSVKLAEALVATGKAFGVKTQAVVSDMNQPLGKFVGNALEVYECIKILRGEADEMMEPTLHLSVELTARMLVAGGLVETAQAARQKIEGVLASGEALEKFRENIIVQSGDGDVCSEPEKLFCKDLLSKPVNADRDGFVSAMDTQSIGTCISEIGGGRTRADDKIDHAVGYSCEVRIGQSVKRGEPVGVVHCRTQGHFDQINLKLQAAHTISDARPAELSLVRAVIS